MNAYPPYLDLGPLHHAAGTIRLPGSKSISNRTLLLAALAGGVTATVLWEVTRHAMVWYFAKLSMVNVIYGAMAAVIVVLLTLEAAAVILLFGAEVIAEIDRSRAGRKRAR